MNNDSLSCFSLFFLLPLFTFLTIIFFLLTTFSSFVTKSMAHVIEKNFDKNVERMDENSNSINAIAFWLAAGFSGKIKQCAFIKAKAQVGFLYQNNQLR